MEHKALKDKLESVDLSSIDNLQWDQERTWSRLNAQLEATTVSKVPFWKYGIAASLFFLTAFIVGYILFYKSSSPKPLSIANSHELAMTIPDIPTNKEVSSQQVIKTPVPNKEETPTVGLKEEKESKELVTQKVQFHTQIKDLSVDKIPVIRTSEVEEPPLDKGSFTKVETPQIEDEIATEQLLTNVSLEPDNNINIPITLTTKPISKRKKRFSVKLFQRKNKPKANRVDKVPALTLFASN